MKAVLPNGVYEISDSYSDSENEIAPDEFVFSKTDRCLKVNFKLDESYKNLGRREFYILGFKVKAEYVRLEP